MVINMKIVVLAGGLTPEREVSLTSGGLIANALIERGHKVVLADIYKGTESADFDALCADTKNNAHLIGESVPDLEKIIAENGGRRTQIGPNILPLCESADVVFIAMHGGMGENGQLQATLDNFNIKYTGSGYIGSALAMDKDLSKQIMSRGNIPTAKWIFFDTATDKIDTIKKEIGLPCVVKPCSCGSSVGVSIVDSEEELTAALDFARKYESSVLVEEKIEGREFSLGILDGEALPPIEIIPTTGFYDYKNKYQGGMTKEICPAELTEKEVERISYLGKRVFSLLRLNGYARADFILGKDGEFYCLEVNNLPGMTPMSLLPQEAAAKGISYGELCDRIVALALKK